ncbi:uncharacterized protein [Salvelinus sp. IW2-2015]|uniref:uncharacterized protein n=1 Tax=Salvelinus sp. IW2-2015 TaxID=2691554 RepID=UPI0038D3B16C
MVPVTNKASAFDKKRETEPPSHRPSPERPAPPYTTGHLQRDQHRPTPPGHLQRDQHPLHHRATSRETALPYTTRPPPERPATPTPPGHLQRTTAPPYTPATSRETSTPYTPGHLQRDQLPLHHRATSTETSTPTPAPPTPPGPAVQREDTHLKRRTTPNDTLNHAPPRDSSTLTIGPLQRGQATLNHPPSREDSSTHPIPPI